MSISRDVVSDSTSVGRVYIPTDYMEDPEKELRIMGKEKNARALGDEKLRGYILKLLQLADIGYYDSLKCIDNFPDEVKAPFLVVVKMY